MIPSKELTFPPEEEALSYITDGSTKWYNL